MPVRLTLINPNFQERVRRVAQTTVGPPLGLAYLASAARMAGHETRILDSNALGLSTVDTVTEALKDEPDVVGITATTPTVTLAGRLAAGIKERRPDVVTVVGGAHTTALPTRSLEEFPGIDIAARGEGESSLPQLLDVLMAGNREAWARIPGFTFRNSDGTFTDTGMSRNLPDLDAIALPARDLLPMERYRCVDSDTFTTLLAMRGCPCACTYCQVPDLFGRKMRHRSPSLVVDEMDKVHGRFGVKFFSFVDDTFTTKKSWVHEFCDRVEESGLHRQVRWICLTRADMVDVPLLRRMKQAGCVRVELGIDTISEQGRQLLKKGLTEEAVVTGFQAAKAVGLSTMGFVILNIPGETEEDVNRTADLVRRVDPDYLQVSFLTPYPGTPLRKEAEEKGWIKNDDWERYGFLNDVVLKNDAFTTDALHKQYLQFVRGFYYRPRTLWKLGRLILSGTTRLRPLLRTLALGIAATVLNRATSDSGDDRGDR